MRRVLSAAGAPDRARHRAVRRVIVVTLLLNLAVAGAKIATGLVFRLASLTADGMHSLVDALNNVTGLIAVATASRPPDEDHPYGHRKFETFAALAVAVFLILAGLGVVREALARRSGGEPPETGAVAYAVALGTLAVNVGVARWERRRARELASDFLEADAAHTGTDVLVTIAVLGAMIAVDLRVPWVDFAAAIAIAAMIAWTAVGLLRSTLDVLGDRTDVDAEEVARIVRAVPGVRSCHKIRTRGPRGHSFADLHVQVDPEMSVRAGHAVAHRVVDAIRAGVPAIVDVVTHIEPFEED